MKNITRITIQHIVDDSGYENWQLSDKPKVGCMVWSTGAFYDKIEQAKQIVSDLDDIVYDDDEKESYIALCEKRRENIQSWIDDNDREERNKYKYFLPPENGEPAGSPEYKKYAEQDYSRATKYYNGDWHYIGIQVIAYSKCVCCNNETEVTRHSLWGIESDCTEYHREIEAELFNELETEIENRDEYSMCGLTIDDCERLEMSY